jgi:hypothetical protein
VLARKNNMQILETIDLRISTADLKSAEEIIKMLVNEKNNSTQMHINYYRNNDIETDYTIQIFHNNIHIEKNGSRAAQEIVFNLKGFGLINHNIWRKL